MSSVTPAALARHRLRELGAVVVLELDRDAMRIAARSGSHDATTRDCGSMSGNGVSTQPPTQVPKQAQNSAVANSVEPIHVASERNE